MESKSGPAFLLVLGNKNSFWSLPLAAQMHVMDECQDPAFLLEAAACFAAEGRMSLSQYALKLHIWVHLKHHVADVLERYVNPDWRRVGAKTRETIRETANRCPKMNSRFGDAFLRAYVEPDGSLKPGLFAKGQLGKVRFPDLSK